VADHHRRRPGIPSSCSAGPCTVARRASEGQGRPGTSKRAVKGGNLLAAAGSAERFLRLHDFDQFSLAPPSKFMADTRAFPSQCS